LYIYIVYIYIYIYLCVRACVRVRVRAGRVDFVLVHIVSTNAIHRFYPSI